MRILVSSTNLFRQPPNSFIHFYPYYDQLLVKPGRRCYSINPQGCTISLVHNLTHRLAFDKSIGTSRLHCLSPKQSFVYYMIFHFSLSSLIFSLSHFSHDTLIISCSILVIFCSP